jgi:exopolysaccharide biosynthesis polyprenyl glycosylphosphotransferase
MVRPQIHVHARLRKLFDASLFVLAFGLAYLWRSNWELQILGGTPEIQPFRDFSWLIFVIFPLAAFFLDVRGYYRRPLLISRQMVIWQLFSSCALVTVSVILVMFLARTQLARSVIILFGFLSLILLIVKEELVRLYLRSRWAQFQLTRRFILVGSADDNALFRNEFRASQPLGIEICAELNLDNTPIESLINQLHDFSANGVILSARHTLFGQIEIAIQICELEGVEVWLLADFFKTQVSKTILESFLDHPVLIFRSAPENSWQTLVKQLLDFCGSLVTLVGLSWLFLVLALLIKITSPGPVFFRQKRSGLNGSPFTMYKFRSMVIDAEEKKRDLAPMNEMSGPVFKITKDPRVTSIGRWLRRYSLDELPQLWNVLCGDMSLVGPRPLPVEEVKQFDDLAHRRRLSVKPGLTCTWQVSGRNNLSDFNDWVKLDLEYIDNWSLWLDLKILLKTIPVVLLGTGAK